MEQNKTTKEQKKQNKKRRLIIGQKSGNSCSVAFSSASTSLARYSAAVFEIFLRLVSVVSKIRTPLIITTHTSSCKLLVTNSIDWYQSCSPKGSDDTGAR